MDGLVRVREQWRTQSVIHVDGSCGALENAKGLDDGRRHPVLRLIDLEILKRPTTSV